MQTQQVSNQALNQRALFRRKAKRELDRLNALGEGLSLGVGYGVTLASTAEPVDLTTVAGGPIHWYREDVTIGTDVSAWLDKGSAPIDFTQGTPANQPVTTAADANFADKRTITGNNTSKFLAAPAAVDWTFLHNGTPGVSCLVVYRPGAAAGGTDVIFDTCNGSIAQVGFEIFQDAATGRLRWFISNGTATVISTNPAGSSPNNVTHWALLRYEEGRAGVEFSEIVDNVTVSSGNSTNAPSSAAPTNAPRILRLSGAGTSYFEGQVAEIAFWNHYLADGLVSTLRSYVTRYGI